MPNFDAAKGRTILRKIKVSLFCQNVPEVTEDRAHNIFDATKEPICSCRLIEFDVAKGLSILKVTIVSLFGQILPVITVDRGHKILEVTKELICKFRPTFFSIYICAFLNY